MDFQPGMRTESGYLALPESGAADGDGSSAPGVLVLHAWWGLNDFFIELCDRLAREGFVALAPDLYSGSVAATIEEAQELMKQKEQGDPAATGEKVLAALDALQAHPAVGGHKVGTLGCSMGAWWGLQAATLRPEAIAATVFFYGVVEGDFGATRCAYQGHFAENDAFDPIEQAHQMEAQIRAAGRDVTFYDYPGVGHWFFESNRPDTYDADSAKRAWDRTVSFLNDSLS